MKKMLLVGMLLLEMCQTYAQAFWILPSTFSYQVGDKTFLQFQTGENFTGTNWQGNRDKVGFLQASSNNYHFNLFPFLGTNVGDSARLDTIVFPGNYTIAYTSKSRYIERNGNDFNQYLQQHGQSEIMRIRQVYNQDTSMGREAVQECAKTLIRVKSRMNKSDYLKSSFYITSSGLPLDIVPIDNPYNLKTSGSITFNVYFLNKPVNSGKLWLWQRKNGSTTKKEINIENGIATATVEPSGIWMLSMLRIIQDPVKGVGYWQTYQGSLTWGYDN